MKTRLTILTENATHQPGLVAEHGWSVWVEYRGDCWLFDTGQSQVFRANAARLGVDLGRTRAILLSHGHYDHTGGLAEAQQQAPGALIYAHPAVLAEKYSKPPDGPARYNGMPAGSRKVIAQHPQAVVWTTTPCELAPGLWLSGEIPRRNDFEDVGGPFFLDPDGRNPDPLLDDMALALRTREGLVILLGCAHAGVVNTIEHFRQITGGLPVHAVMGGMHLLRAGAERMSATLEALQRLGVQRLGAAHCTGFAATAALVNRFAGRCFPCHAGMVFEFDL